MTTQNMPRRAVLGGTALSAVVLAQGAAPRALARGADDPFEYEVVRSDAEWRDRLTMEEYLILRHGGTEPPETSPLWRLEDEGSYCCKGCDLTIYDSVWKVSLDKGWAFFRQSRENAVLTSIDGSPPGGMGPAPVTAMIEAHCRRCGSHLGHILTVEGETLHCINGLSLVFEPATV